MKAYVIEAQDFELFFEVFSEKEKFSANELPTQTISTKVCKNEQPEPINDLEWESDSEWGSEPEFESKSADRIQSKHRKRTRSRTRTPNPKKQCVSSETELTDDERELIRRRFEETLY